MTITKSIQALTPEERAQKQNRAVCKVIFSAFDEFSLSEGEQAKILGVDPKTIERWKKKGLMTLEKQRIRESASHFVAIVKSLSAMFSSKHDRAAWVKSFHPDFDEVPLVLMKSSMEGLANVRRYLDYVRGRGA